MATKNPRKHAPSAPPLHPLGGRMAISVGMALAMFAAASSPAEEAAGRINDLFEREMKPTDMTRWAPGEIRDIELTLVTADYEKLGCVLDREVEGTRCEYKSEKELWPLEGSAPVDDNKKSIIQPYSAVPDNALIFVAGLWAQPEVAMRLHKEPYEGTDPKRLARFIVRCKVKTVERIGGVKIRWNKNDSWQDGRLKVTEDRYENPWVAVAQSCQVRDE